MRHRYLRAQNPYTPPPQVWHIIDKLKATANCTTGTHEKVFSLEDKFNFLMLCSAEFKHTVPSSVLHEMNTFGKLGDGSMHGSRCEQRANSPSTLQTT